MKMYLVASYNARNGKVFQITSYPSTIRHCMKFISKSEPFRDPDKRYQLIEIDLDKNLIDYVGDQ